VEIARLLRARNGDRPFDELAPEAQKKAENLVKRRLYLNAVPLMTLPELRAVDSENEIENVLRRIGQGLG
jgi:hypothetical protein